MSFRVTTIELAEAALQTGSRASCSHHARSDSTCLASLSNPNGIPAFSECQELLPWCLVPTLETKRFAQGPLCRLLGQTELYSHARHLPTLVLDVGSLSPSQYPLFSITH